MTTSLMTESARMLAACDLIAEPASGLDVESVAETTAELIARLLACESGLVIVEGPGGATVRSYPAPIGASQAHTALDRCQTPGRVFDRTELGFLAAGGTDVLGVSFAAAGRYRGVVVGIGPTRHPFGALDEWLLLVTARRVSGQLETVALHIDRLADQQLVLDARLAGELQQQLIGPFPPVPDLDIAGVLEPARHVGGDLHGWDSDADGTTVAVADVSGKGASAALLMASVQASLRHAFALEKTRPADVIEHVRAENEDVLERTSRLVTMAVARFDRDGTVRIASAGQSPVVVRLGGTSQLVTPHVPPLGVPGRPATESVFTLTGDDALLVGTDGLIDQRDEYGSQFGVEGVLEAFERARGGANDMVEQIHARVVAHRGAAQQEDDIALVVVLRKDVDPC